MYHCNIQIYFVGYKSELFQCMKEMPPLTHFKHSFLESNAPLKTCLSRADVIIADLSTIDSDEAIEMILTERKKDSELILLAKQDQKGLLLQDDKAEITDIWTFPLSVEEVKFRFLRWQQNYKQSKELWLSQNYLDTTINSVPHLIWYKDRAGAHLKVNESFCKAVNKTMEQVEGRGHYYIWDMEPSEYAKGEYICMESEFEVMDKKETCVFDEKVKIKNDMRQLKTYKSPLFDLDGSVMGTVGVAVDVTQERIYQDMIVNNANTDFLTGLYNRRYVSKFIEEKEDQPLTIFYLDLDHFKSVNDEYGHKEGDSALVMTAETLKVCMPEGMIARIGGDEFLVIVTGQLTDQEIGAKKVWLQEQLDAVYAQKETLKRISVSIGTAHSDAGKAVMDELISEADTEMYREKNEKKQRSNI